MANKQDLPDARSCDEIAKALDDGKAAIGDQLLLPVNDADADAVIERLADDASADADAAELPLEAAKRVGIFRQATSRAKKPKGGRRNKGGKLQQGVVGSPRTAARKRVVI